MRCKCGKEISEGRFRLGIRTCLECGVIDARLEIERKSKRIAPAYNKGGLVYMGDETVAAENLRNSGTAACQGRDVHFTQSTLPAITQSHVKPKQQEPKRIPVPLGFFRLSGNPDTQCFYTEDDPRLSVAIHVVKYPHRKAH